MKNITRLTHERNVFHAFHKVHERHCWQDLCFNSPSSTQSMKQTAAHCEDSYNYRLEKLGLSPSPNGESLSFSYTIIHKIHMLSDSTKKLTCMSKLNHYTLHHKFQLLVHNNNDF